MSQELMPIQTLGGWRRKGATIPKAVYMRAYEVYSHVHQPQERMITGDCRGGFGAGELVAYLYAASFPKDQWHNRVEEAIRGNTLDQMT